MMPERLIFPILKGESVGESGEYTGKVVIICEADELSREWDADSIAVLDNNLADHFEHSPGDLDNLFSKVRVVLAEFGESIGLLSSIAFSREAICIVKVFDATHVLEDDMHIRVVAIENTGEVFFID